MTRYLRSEEVGTPTIARRRVWPLVTALLAGLLALGILVMCLGNYQVAPSTVAKILVGQIPGIHADVTWPRAVETVVLHVRLPRTLGAMCVGAALALSGATYQGVFRNPSSPLTCSAFPPVPAWVRPARFSCTRAAHPCR